MTLKIGFEQAKSVQELQTLSLVVSSIFGKSDSKGSNKDSKRAEVPASFEDAERQLAALLGR